MRVGLQLQAHRLLSQQTRKLIPTGSNPSLVRDEVPDDAVVSGQPLPGRDGLQTNNPGWPGFSSSGWILGGGINVSLGF